MMKKGILLCVVSFILTACAITPEPTSVSDRYDEARRNMRRMFAHQNLVPTRLNYYQALALGLKYNLDYRIKLANNALQADQLRLAEFAMFPSLNTSASLYSRNNDLSSFGTTETGQITNVLNSTPRTLRSMRVGLTWNILDFGASYVKAKQQGERYLIAEEEARKQVQQLSQDILRSYWEAYSAQEMLDDTRAFQKQLNEAKRKLEAALLDKTIPKENILHYQEALLDGNRHLIQLKYKYEKAILDLKHLANLPLNRHFVLAPPPSALMHPQDLSNLDFKKLDAITLVKRPELNGQHYQYMIAKMGVKAAVLQALPGVTLSPGWNYNSNKFLLNRIWMDQSVDAAWNLLNLASLPASLDSARSQVKYEKLKLMALTLTVLTETRYAYSHYQNLLSEYQIAHKQTQNAKALYQLAYNRNRASLSSHQQMIIAKLKSITAKMDEDLLLADLSTARGELYLSAGFDIIPIEATNEPLPIIIKKIKANFAAQKTMDFNRYVETTHKRLFSYLRVKSKK